MNLEWCTNPAKLCVFWGVVLLLLILVLTKLWGLMDKKNAATERADNRDYRQKDPYSSGATQRFAQHHETPYLQNCIEYNFEARAEHDRKLALNKNSEPVSDGSVTDEANNLALSNVDPEVVNSTSEYLSGTRGYAAHDAVHPKTIGHHEGHYEPPSNGVERLASARDGPMHWFIGNNITDLKNEVSGQDPDLDVNRWTMQLQNQVSDLRSDTVEGQLAEDVLFRRSVANM